MSVHYDEFDQEQQFMVRGLLLALRRAIASEDLRDEDVVDVWSELRQLGILKES